MKTHLLLPLLSLAFVCQSASAEIITFDFEGAAGMDLDGLTSGTTSITSAGGITLTLTADAIGGSFNLNSPTSGNVFGINNPSGNDDADAFDNGGTATEGMTFTIESNVSLANLSLTSIDFDRFNSGDSGSIAKGSSFLGGFAIGIFDVDDLDGADLLTFSPPESGILSTDILTLSNVTGGWGLEAITFEATAAAVPEPQTLLLLSTGFGLFAIRSFRRRNKSITAELD